MGDGWIEGFSNLQMGQSSRLKELREYEKEKNYEEALQQLLQLQRDTGNKNAIIHFSLAMNLTNMNKLADAETAFKNALSLEPKLFRGHFMLASLQVRRGLEAESKGNRFEATILYDEARKHAEIATGLGTTDAWVYHLQGEVLLKLAALEGSKEKADKLNAEALEALRRAVDGRPEQPLVQMLYGEALARSGNQDKAKLHFGYAVQFAKEAAGNGKIDPRPGERLAKWEAEWKKK